MDGAPSGRSNSLITGKVQGIFRHLLENWLRSVRKYLAEQESNARIPYASEQGIFAHLCREICAQAGKICFPQEGTEFFDSPAQLEPGIACVQAANSVVPDGHPRRAHPEGIAHGS